MVLNNIFVLRKLFPLILAFAVTIHKCQALSLDCALMDLSDEVFSPGMAFVALSRVKRLENLHLIEFNPQSIIISSKSLQEINRLQQTYCPNLPQYPVPSAQPKALKCKWKLSGTVVSTSPPSKLPTVSGKRKKAYTRMADKEVSHPAKKT